MNSQNQAIAELFSIRNQYGNKISERKINLLREIEINKLFSKKAIHEFSDTLNFLIAYPGSSEEFQLAKRSLIDLTEHCLTRERLKYLLYNSGVPGTRLSASFSFEIIKWLNQSFPKWISLNEFEAEDSTIQSILSAVMSKTESEIMQDANENWRTWLRKTNRKDQDNFHRIISIFDQADMRPEVRDELWGALGIDVEVTIPAPSILSDALVEPHYHSELLRKESEIEQLRFSYKKKNITIDQASEIIDCARMTLVQNFREIDPITFTSPELVSYYQLPRGISIAIVGMVPTRCHPIDSYFGYIAFKNGNPIAYAGSWMLFDSGRIGLNVFPSFRGGESVYIFRQILKLHERVFNLNRLSVDPYQLGKENHDGIDSGAFWVWYKAGFQPLKDSQKKLAESEANKINLDKNYRSPKTVLNTLADSRMELIFRKGAVRFDANDLAVAYANILKEYFNNNRKFAEAVCLRKLLSILKIKNHGDANLDYILKCWCVLLISEEDALRKNMRVQSALRKLFLLKAKGDEMNYISLLQKSTELKRLLERIVSENVKDKF